MAGAGLRDTRRRIKSVEATKKITRAMELIAAARIPKARARVAASEPYARKLVDVIQNVGSAGGAIQHPLLERRDMRTVGILVVSADRGLAGAYATNVIRKAERAMLSHIEAGREVVLYVVGKKAQTYFRYRGYTIKRAYLAVTDAPGYGDARAIANTIMEEYAVGEIDAVEAFYTRYVSAMTQEPTGRMLLPLARPEREADAGPSAAYAYEPSPDEILSRILPRYVEATIFIMLLEASASEHSARRRAMKAATDNAEELIRILTVQANRARQGEITTAITEIVGGAEALAGEN
jgi:F-type H+-transporting ATPase subunit gamma